MQLDYSLSTPEERVRCVEQVISETPSDQLTNNFLNYMSDYILFVADKDQTKKERNSDKPVLTKNREITINKRQVSFEEIVSNLETGEDGLYALISEDKNQILDPKDPITESEIDEIPGMREHYSLILHLKEKFKKAQGKQRYYIKKTIIETWQQMYILKASHYAMHSRKIHNNGQIKTLAKANLQENITIDKNGLPRSDALLTLLNPDHIAYLLSYYSKLKEESYDDLQSDMRWLLIELEDLVDRTLKEDYPLLYDLVIWKIDGLTNEEIQRKVEAVYGEQHNEQYYSSLWRKRIPNLLLEQKQKDVLIWYYTNIEYGYWKKCSKCGEIKLGHPLFFNKNSSKDGFYSQCKDCRKEKRKKSK